MRWSCVDLLDAEVPNHDSGPSANVVLLTFRTLNTEYPPSGFRGHGL